MWTRRRRRLASRQHADCRRASTALAELLRCPVEVGLTVEPRTYGEFVAGLPVPACFNVLRSRGLPETRHSDASEESSTYRHSDEILHCAQNDDLARHDGFDDCLLLDIELAILFPMIDRLLGGAGDGRPPSRPLTEIELPLAARIVRLFLHCLESNWRPSDKQTGEPWPAAESATCRPVSFEIIEVGSNPRLLRTLPAEEAVLVVGFRLDVGEKCGGGTGSASGMARLCIPCRAVERVAAGRGGLEADAGRAPPGHRRETAVGGGRHSPKFGPSPLSDDALTELSVSWPATQITAEQLASLRPGDIIATDAAADGAVLVSLDGEPKFLGKPLAWGGHRAVRIGGTVG